MNEEEEVEDKEEVKSEDEEEDSKRETMPDEDADEAHPETTEAGADEADEPLSDSDAEPEAEPDHKQKKGKKKLPEEHDKTPRPPARSAAAISITQHLQNLHWPVKCMLNIAAVLTGQLANQHTYTDVTCTIKHIVTTVYIYYAVPRQPLGDETAPFQGNSCQVLNALSAHQQAPATAAAPGQPRFSKFVPPALAYSIFAPTVQLYNFLWQLLKLLPASSCPPQLSGV